MKIFFTALIAWAVRRIASISSFLSKPVGLFAFAAGTSLGYFLFSAFLWTLRPEVLIVNTYVWFLISHSVSFKGWRIHVLNPLRGVTFILSRHSLLVAILNFGYWLFFWVGFSRLALAEVARAEGSSSATDASGLALMILAFVVIVQPFAKRQAAAPRDRGSLSKLIFLGLLLAAGLLLTKVELQTMQAWFCSTCGSQVEQQMTVLAPAQSWPEEARQTILGVNTKYLHTLFFAFCCFALAVIFEGLSDYFAASRERRYSNNITLFDELVSVTNAINLVRFLHKSWVRETIDIVELKNETVQVLALQINGLTSAKKLLVDKIEQSPVNLVQLEQEKLINIDNDLSEAISLHQRLQAAEKEKLIELLQDEAARYSGPVLQKITPQNQLQRHPATVLATDELLSLNAVIGLILSAVVCAISWLFFGTSSLLVDIKSTNGMPVYSFDVFLFYFIALSLLGFFGSSAKVLFLYPFIRDPKESEMLVAPIYAVRPAIYLFLVYYLFSKITTFMRAHGAIPNDVPINENALQAHLTGNVIAGLTLGIVVATIAWFEIWRTTGPR